MVKLGIKKDTNQSYLCRTIRNSVARDTFHLLLRSNLGDNYRLEQRPFRFWGAKKSEVRYYREEMPQLRTRFKEIVPSYFRLYMLVRILVVLCNWRWMVIVERLTQSAYLHVQAAEPQG